MIKKFLITCDEASTICDKSQYNEASFFEKIQLNLHFLICKICALYSKQNTKMSVLYKMKTKDCKKEKRCISQKEKAILKKQLEEFKI
jgi:hypothetical protein